MAGKSNYLELELLKYATGQANALGTAPTAVNIGLYTTAPTSDTDAGTEVSGVNYARVDSSGSWGTPSGVAPATVATNTIVQFPTAGAGGWGTVVAFGIFDQSGNRLYWNNLTASQLVDTNETARFAAGALQLTED